MPPSEHQWSQWAWDPSQAYRYRCRRNDRGELVYEYSQEGQTEPDMVPRSDAADVQGLAEEVAGLRYSTDEGTRPEHQEHRYEFSSEPSAKPSPKTSPSKHWSKSGSYKPSGHRDHNSKDHKNRDRDRDRDRDRHRDRDRSDKKSSSSSSKPKSRGKAPPETRDRAPAPGSGRAAETHIEEPEAARAEGYAHDEAAYQQSTTYSGEAACHTGNEAAHPRPGRSKGKSRAVDDYDDHEYDPEYHEGGASAQAAGHWPQDQAFDEEGGMCAEMRTAMRVSREMHAPATHNEYAEPSNSGAYAPFDGSDEPALTAMSPGISLSGGGDHDELDPRYKLEMSWKFYAGMLFKVLWPEPMGSNQIPSTSDKQRIPDGYGGDVHVGFRRFLVIATDFGHSTCVPIVTYNSQGCRKRGVKPEKHGIIYENGKRPRLLDGEPALGFKPVSVNITAEGEALSRESRVNYSKLITVEHNVKVFFIGQVADEDFHVAAAAVDTCWQNKNREMRHAR